MKKLILTSLIALTLFSCQNEERGLESRDSLQQENSKIQKMNFTLEDGSKFVVSIDLKTNKTIENEGSKQFEKFALQNSRYVMCYDSDNSAKLFKTEKSLSNYLNSQNENSIAGNNNPINLICSGYVNLYDDVDMSNLIANYSTNQPGFYTLSNLGTSVVKYSNSSFQLYGPRYCYSYNNTAPGLSNYRNYIYFDGFEKSGNLVSFLVYDWEKKVWVDYNNKIFRIDVMGEHCYIKA